MEFLPKYELPSVTDDEVKVFHPYFQSACEDALQKNKLSAQYAVDHHYTTSSGIVDFVIRNVATNRIILCVEIKRTKSATISSGRRQARDYFNNLGIQMSRSYYCSTNLEIIELFRHDDSRKETHSQQVEVPNELIGDFAESNKIFYNSLVNSLSDIIEIVINDKGVYKDKLTHIRDALANSVHDIDEWHKVFVPTTFEYLIGLASKNNGLKQKLKSLGWPTTVEKYKSNPQLILTKGTEINFNDVFCAPVPSQKEKNIYSSSLLQEAYDAGASKKFGDDIAEIINSILKPVGKGIVETDPELARLLAVLAHNTLGRQLESDEVIWDPCAGSGRLLAGIEPAFEDVAASQIWANEIETRFKEPLSLRLGMKYIDTLTPVNSPRVTIGSIDTIQSQECEKVKVVLMNPPYLSGIESVQEKKALSARILEITGSKSLLHTGQIALEAVFIELVTRYLKKGTVVACILPIQHLTRNSKEVAIFRSFLLNEFGLQSVVSYPMDGLFSEVIKETVILVGKLGCRASEVEIINFESAVSNLDLRNLVNGKIKSSRGITVQSHPSNILEKRIKSGWRGLLGAGIDAAKFVEEKFNHFKRISSLEADDGTFRLKRGTLANSGNSKLTAIKQNDPEMGGVLKLIPKNWQYKALVKANSVPIVAQPATLTEISFIPPIDAYIDGTSNNTTLKFLINEYLSIGSVNKGKQKKAIKSCDDIIKDLKKDQELSSNSVLIPRNLRANGTISVINQDAIVLSTNFIKIEVSEPKYRTFLASWLLSVFGQIQFELFSNLQEGTRKIEKGSVSDLYVPDIGTVDHAKVESLISGFNKEKPLSFKSLVKRNIDIIWAEILDPKDPDKLLDEAFQLMERLIMERNP